MAIAKAKSSNDYTIGVAVVAQGDAAPKVYDPGPPETLHFADVNALAVIANINSKYKYHGGAGGSGNWEH